MTLHNIDIRVTFSIWIHIWNPLSNRIIASQCLKSKGTRVSVSPQWLLHSHFHIYLQFNASSTYTILYDAACDFSVGIPYTDFFRLYPLHPRTCWLSYIYIYVVAFWSGASPLMATGWCMHIKSLYRISKPIQTYIRRGNILMVVGRQHWSGCCHHPTSQNIYNSIREYGVRLNPQPNYSTTYNV